MTLNASQIAKLNKMNRAAKDASLGTAVSNLETASAAKGVVTVSAAQASASAVAVTTGLTAVAGEIHNLYRSGSPIRPDYLKGALSGGNINFTSASAGYVMAAGDIINWIAF